MFEIIESSINKITDILLQGDQNLERVVANINCAACSSIIGERQNIFFHPMENHRFFEIAVSLFGTFVMQISQDYFYMRENQLCIIEKDKPHRIGWCLSPDKPSVVLWVTIAGSVIRIHTTTYNPNHTYDQSFGFDVCRLDDFILHEILWELKNREKNYEKIASIHIASFLQLLLRRMDAVRSENQYDWGNTIIKEVELYISRNLHTKLSLNQISDTVSLSPNYLSMLFKQITGRNLSGYIREARLQRASKLLVETDEKISVIAEQLGFYDQFHFSKAFKQYTGINPSSFRSMRMSPYFAAPGEGLE